MASSKVPVIAFTGGEVDRETLTRIDLDIAPQTAETLENIFLISSGGMTLAPGTQFLEETPNSDPVILRPWSRSQELSYALEIGAGQMRFLFEEGYEILEGAPATIGDFTDESAAPTGGGPPPGGGGALTVTVEDGFWVLIKGGYHAICSYSVMGGNGDYVSPSVVTILSGTVTSASASGGIVTLTRDTPDTVTFEIDVDDTAGNTGTSNVATVL